MPTEKQEKETKSADNLMLYNKVRAVPEDAQKSIGGGRLRGMTDWLYSEPKVLQPR